MTLLDFQTMRRGSEKERKRTNTITNYKLLTAKFCQTKKIDLLLLSHLQFIILCNMCLLLYPPEMYFCFTDASYDPQMKCFSCYCFSCYPYGIENEFEQTIQIIVNIKSTLHYNNVTICTDCESGINEFQNDRISMIHIKGHTKKLNRDDIGLIFRDVDKLARKKLRQIRKER